MYLVSDEQKYNTFGNAININHIIENANTTLQLITNPPTNILTLTFIHIFTIYDALYIFHNYYFLVTLKTQIYQICDNINPQSTL